MGMESVRRKYKPRGDPPSPIPTHIRLPDGRRVPTSEITQRVSEITNLKVVNGKIMVANKAPNPFTTNRYTLSERKWISESDLFDIKTKYCLDDTQAATLKIHSRKILRNTDLI